VLIKDVFRALTDMYESRCRAKIELAEICDYLEWYDHSVRNPIQTIVQCKAVTSKRHLVKQFERVFSLFDLHESGLVSKSDISFYLLQIKDIVSAELDFSLIKDFDSFQVDHREVDLKFFIDLI
jgi:hypothetical protein